MAPEKEMARRSLQMSTIWDQLPHGRSLTYTGSADDTRWSWAASCSGPCACYGYEYPPPRSKRQGNIIDLTAQGLMTDGW